MPLVKRFSVDVGFALVVCVLEPIRREYSTALLAGTAEAALRTLGEDDPSVIFDSE